MAELTRKTSKNARLKELEEIYETLPPEKKALATPLIQNAVFIEEQMLSLQKIIEAEGTVDEYVNGANQYGKKQSANVQSYNAFVKSYNTINARLDDLLKERQKKTASKLEKLMNE